MIAYAAKVSGAKVILYAWDDNYSYPYSKSPFLRAVHFFGVNDEENRGIGVGFICNIGYSKRDYEKIFQWSVR